MSDERVCPTCGKHFVPATKSQVYDTDYCRVKAYRQRHKKDQQLAPLDGTGMLDEIRRLDPETARDIEALALKAGKKMAEDILFVCWRAMQRGARRLALTDAESLIEEGAIKVKKRRAHKT